ncbi:MAG: hypothetical protein HY326_13185 [Chloroflexi bacterium]|nr:hypothetical protein [Chloroflexota bacterium]
MSVSAFKRFLGPRPGDGQPLPEATVSRPGYVTILQLTILPSTLQF